MYQHPLIPLVFSALLIVLVIKQCITKRQFLKVRLFYAVILTFISALILVFYPEIQKDENIEEQIDLFFESNDIRDEEAKKYIKDVILGIEKNKEQILSNIEKNLKEDWKLSRISKMDLSILELAIYEIEFSEVPYKVAINEAVELAKKYGEDKSKNFVNGILASIVKDM